MENRLEHLRTERTNLSALVGLIARQLKSAQELKLAKPAALLADALFSAESALYDVELQIRTYLGDDK